MNSRDMRIMVCGFAILLCSNLQAADTHPGKLLYENHCGGCHTPAVHERPQRKVESLTDLSKWVIRWQYHLKLNWSVEEVSQVINYLNTQYYHKGRLP